MKKQLLWWAGVVVLALALGGQYTLYRAGEGMAVGHATWNLSPTNFDDVVKAAQNVVEVEVVRVEAGQELVLDIPNHPDRIPTERVVVRVVEAVKGNAAAGQELNVFRTGGRRIAEQPAGALGQPDDTRNNTQRLKDDGSKPVGPDAPAPPPARTAPDEAPVKQDESGLRIFLLPEDPPYEVGDRYLLALTEGPQGMMRPVHPAGRYKIEGDNLEAVGDDPVSMSLDRRSLGDAQAAARGQMTIPTTNPDPDQGGLRRRVTTGGEVGMPRTGNDQHSFNSEPGVYVWIGIGIFVLGLVLGAVSLVTSRLQSARRS